MDLGSWENQEATLEEEKNIDLTEKEMATHSCDQVLKGTKYADQREKCAKMLGESSEDALT